MTIKELQDKQTALIAIFSLKTGVPAKEIGQFAADLIRLYNAWMDQPLTAEEYLAAARSLDSEN